MKSSKYISASSLALAALSGVGGVWATKGWAACSRPINDGTCASIIIDDTYASTYASDFTTGVFFKNDTDGVITADGVRSDFTVPPWAFKAGILVYIDPEKGPITLTNLGQVNANLSSGINASTAQTVIYNGASTATENANAIISSYFEGLYSNRRFILHNYGTIEGHDSGVVSEIYSYTEGSVIVNYESGKIVDNQAGGGVYGSDIAVVTGWDSTSLMDTITNVGTLKAANYHIANPGTLGVFNNGQGVGNDEGAVKYTGALPTQYNAVIYGTGEYGQLDYLSSAKWGSAGIMSFGIYGADEEGLVDGVAASTLSSGTYTNVLTGLLAENIADDNNTLTADQLAIAGVTNAKASGEYGGYLWALVASAFAPSSAPNLMSPTPLVELTSWDLIVFLLGPDAANTLTGIRGLAADTAAVMQNRQAAIINGLDHDCAAFGRNSLCVTAGVQFGTTEGREAANQSLGHLVAAYRLSDLSRVGLFLDQQLDMQAVGGAKLRSAIPTIGGYFDYGAADLTGPQLRLAASAGQGELDLRRSDILDNTEAGMGEADLSYYRVLAKVGYGATLGAGWVATPYAALRHTAVERKGYAEAAADTVTKPVRYDAVTMAQTTAVLGARLNGKLDDKVSFELEAGVEHDIRSSLDKFSGTPDITDLESFSVKGGHDFTQTRAFGGAAIRVRVDALTTVNFGVMARQMAYEEGLDVVARAGVAVAL